MNDLYNEAMMNGLGCGIDSEKINQCYIPYPHSDRIIGTLECNTCGSSITFVDEDVLELCKFITSKKVKECKCYRCGTVMKRFTIDDYDKLRETIMKYYKKKK